MGQHDWDSFGAQKTIDEMANEIEALRLGFGEQTVRCEKVRALRRASKEYAVLKARVAELEGVVADLLEVGALQTLCMCDPGESCPICRAEAALAAKERE